MPTVIKTGGKIVGAKLSKQEKKALDIEVRKAVAEMDKNNTREIDAMVLWILHDQFGFGPTRLKRFHNNFVKSLDALIERYEMGKEDRVWLCTHELEKYGINLDEWDKELDEKNQADGNVNTCVCCGAVIPEGIQVCRECEIENGLIG
jgi:hypothetical protein